MISFRNDYSEGAHPVIFDALSRTNLDSTVGYGRDACCERAAQKLKSVFACPEADVHFLTGGTIANLCVITAALRPWEAAIAADTAHICVHETGSIEAAGHKICSVPTSDGKLTAELVRQVVMAHRVGDEEHMVMPRLVYVSDATELGTLYTRQELLSLHTVCRELGLYLYLDGARMAAALVAEDNDLRPEDFAQLCDCFYVGGTKDGLLFGEAVVIVNDELKPHFRNLMKQRGAILAKGRLLGVQFDAFFTDGLWLKMAEHAVSCAQRIASAMRRKGYAFYVESTTNQLFPILSSDRYAALSRDFDFELTAKLDEQHSAVRFVTSWATEEASVQALIDAL